MSQIWTSSLAVLFALSLSLASAQDKKPVIPHAQDKPPNEPRDPQTAAKMMTVPEGFSVEVVAAEPDIVNPIAMTIDERGRFWITESLEYPRKSAGPGKDRVKILEDTDGDGKCDKFTVFLDGLNIPSGVAVGHGGVWIANSPDILFVPDADRDGIPDGPPQVVVTGFGRTDTHELPNSLTWGPDGWLYGLNGVFNYSKVTYPKDSPWLKERILKPNATEEEIKANPRLYKTTGIREPPDGKPSEFTFTCAMFRIHPRTREFQIFAEGTSNPWGIAFNDEGEAFISACVIDHLWHIVETGYYHRQGGPYPPFTWKIDSIVKHKHQKAAYCGIHYFDSDAYPEQYRGKLYMGNIHGGCINVDKLQRDGSTYFATGEPDFLTANDAWFMPVVQKTGPDGCLYILDWYDRYHCYQDANRDPAGIDRLKGRLYRVRYNGKEKVEFKGKVREGEAPAEPRTSSDPQRATKTGSAGASPSQAARRYPLMDLAKETDEQLIERLGANNDFIRWTATRLLQERDSRNIQTQVLAKISDKAVPPGNRMQALFTLSGLTLPQPEWNDAKNWYAKLRQHDDATVQAWAIRLLANRGNLDACFVEGHWLNRPATVALQFASATSKLPKGFDRVALTALIGILANHRDDRLIPHIVWQNLHPRLEDQANDFVALLGESNLVRSKHVADLMPRVAERILGRQKFDAQPIGKLFALLRDDHPQVGRQVLEVISAKVQSGELKGEKLDQLK
ncbi:MAG: PVC-type heme-binding CxxCH protein, partial [Planctomycetaceae bacterium]